MKKYFVFAVFMLFAVTCFSQDYIYLKSGEALEVIVLEEGAITVRYRYFDDTSKKMYFVEKSDIYKIVYQNGKEVIYNKPEKRDSDSRNQNQIPERDNYIDNRNPTRDDYYTNRTRPDNYENRRQDQSNSGIENYARKREPFSEFHVGVVLPQFQVDDADVDVVATGFNLGYKYHSPLSGSYLSLVFGLDAFYNGISSDAKDEDDDSDYPTFWNFSAIAGLNFAYPVSSGLSIYGEIVGGLNCSKMTDLSNSLTTNVGVSGSGKTTFEPGFGFCYAFGGGILINDKISIGLKYNDLNSYNYKYKAKMNITGGGVNENVSDSGKLPETFSLANLTISLGILF